MSAAVHKLFTESPAEFIRRNGPTLTAEVAMRFGWYMKDTLRTMKALERKGLVKSRLVTFEQGAGYEWF